MQNREHVTMPYNTVVTVSTAKLLGLATSPICTPGVQLEQVIRKLLASRSKLKKTEKNIRG